MKRVYKIILTGVLLIGLFSSLVFANINDKIRFVTDNVTNNSFDLNIVSNNSIVEVVDLNIIGLDKDDYIVDISNNKLSFKTISPNKELRGKKLKISRIAVSENISTQPINISLSKNKKTESVIYKKIDWIKLVNQNKITAKEGTGDINKLYISFKFNKNINIYPSKVILNIDGKEFYGGVLTIFDKNKVVDRGYFVFDIPAELNDKLENGVIRIEEVKELINSNWELEVK